MNLRRVLHGAVILALALASAGAPAQALGDAGGRALAPAPAGPAVSLTQRLDVLLPLQLPFTDADGHAIRLADEFDAAAGSPRANVPVILVLGYLHCPQLCGVLMQGLIEATRDAGLPPASHRIVFVSIDPTDTPADAAARRRIDLDYARFLDVGRAAAPPPALDLLVGPRASIAALAQAVGEVYEAGSVPQAARFAHPAGVIVATPGGRISRYLMGVRFDPDELHAAIVTAADGRVGSVSDRIALLCAHLDVRLGRLSLTVIEGTRLLGAATIALLALLVWRQRLRVRARANATERR